ncbi:replication initiation factor domain-containing protein [Sphingomonas aurantiaca]|uniref:replication initiation factor domain-containing protein n=1 Tax=Sphingomonas aurantiaca TaxID=185949 RepID=UPI002FE34EEE
MPGVEIEAGRAPKNFEGGAKIVLNGQIIGWTGWGSDTGRTLLYVDGSGCRLLARTAGFAPIEQAIASLDGARYTRVDIASDTYKGEVETDSILAAYEKGRFQCGRSKKNPQQKIITSKDSQGNPLGSTIYVGADGATKLARCYEKGLQLFGKNPASSISRAAMARVLKSVPGQMLVDQLGDEWKEKLDGWYRVEIQYRHDKKRPLKLDMLTHCDENFSGAYPFCSDLLPNVNPERPDYIIDEAEAKLITQGRACRASYGGYLNTLHSVVGLTKEEIFDFLVGDEPSRKLREAGIMNVQQFKQAFQTMLETGVVE